EDGIRAFHVTGVQTCALPIWMSGRATVPLLWDQHTDTIVSNESSEIMRMFNDAYDHLGARPGDYYPQALRAEIDRINARVYPERSEERRVGSGGSWRA